MESLRVIDGTHYRNGQIVVPYQFERNTIKIQVPDDIKYGNYRIGIIDNGWFKVKYVGRATDQPLQARLLQHKDTSDDHYYDDSYYFFVSAAASVEEAKKQECIDFHSFGGEEFLDNKYHPSLPEGVPCPWQGCEHVGGE